MRTALIFIAVAASAAVAGCYELASPIIDKGEQAPIAGTFDCRSMFENRRLTFAESKRGYLMWADYRYANPAGEEQLAVRKLRDTLYAAQAETKDGIFAVYLDIPSTNSFLIRAPNILEQGRAIDVLASQHGITSRASTKKPDFIRLEAPKVQLARFIFGHTAENLTTVLECHRVQT